MSTSFTEPTFSASSYLEHRPRYPQRLYETVLEFHKTGSEHGDRNRLAADSKLALDLGCGPGIVTAQLVPHFDKVIGIDEAESMVALARQNVPEAEFMVGSAAHMPEIETGTVDLITVGTAAHWFPSDWWQEASRVVKPGGTLAAWVYSEKMLLEPSHPKADEINKHIMTFVDKIGNQKPGNELAFSMYDTLPLPAPELKFGPVKRMSWNREGTKNGLFMCDTMTIDTLRKRMHTYSPVYRWRQAHPSKADTDEDPIEQVLNELKKIAGWDDSTNFSLGYPLALLTMKKC